MSHDSSSVNGITQNQPYTTPLQYGAEPLRMPATVKVASKDHEAGFIIVNASDVDPATMVEFREPAA